MCHQLSLLSLRNNQLRLLPESIENLFELTVLNIVNNRLVVWPRGIVVYASSVSPPCRPSASCVHLLPIASPQHTEALAACLVE